MICVSCAFTAIGGQGSCIAPVTRDLHAGIGGSEMTKIWLLSGVLVLAGCSGGQEAEPTSADDVSADVESVSSDPSMWGSADDAAGTYTLLYTDGTEGTLTATADGTAEGVIGGEEFTASFTIPEPGKVCYSVKRRSRPRARGTKSNY